MLRLSKREEEGLGRAKKRAVTCPKGCRDHCGAEAGWEDAEYRPALGEQGRGELGGGKEGGDRILYGAWGWVRGQSVMGGLRGTGEGSER